MSRPLGYLAPRDLKAGGVGGAMPVHPAPLASCWGCPAPSTGSRGRCGARRRRKKPLDHPARRWQLPLGPCEQQAPEREGPDCRSGSGLPGRERSPWHLKRQALAPGTRSFPHGAEPPGSPAPSGPRRPRAPPRPRPRAGAGLNPAGDLPTRRRGWRPERRCLRRPLGSPACPLRAGACGGLRAAGSVRILPSCRL